MVNFLGPDHVLHYSHLVERTSNLHTFRNINVEND